MKSAEVKSIRATSPRIFAFMGVLVVFGIAAVTVYLLTHRKKSSTPVYTSNAQTTSTAPSAQTDFSAGTGRSAPTTNTDKGNAVVSDNKGAINQDVSTNNPTVSKTGQISVYSPQKNQLLKNGDQLAGTATIGTVKYRVIDNVSGVIAEGTLSVVNGKFSGTISFSTTASEGRLDVYGAKDDGTEFSNVEIPVRFK